MNIAFLTISLCVLPLISGYNILLLAPFPGPSHWLFLQHFVRGLVGNGHHVTAITGIKYSGQPLSNYTEVYIDPPLDLRESMTPEMIYDMKFDSSYEGIDILFGLGLKSTQHALNSKNVKNFIKNNRDDFDLILSEQFFQESFLMFAHKYKAPIVTISTYGHSDFFDRFMGFYTPWAVVSHVDTTYTDEMSFFERIDNLFISIYDVVKRNFVYLPEHDKFAQEAFKELNAVNPLPSVKELEKQISMVLVNSHRGIASPRPTMPGIVNIAGAHIVPPKALPDDLKKFLDEAKDGVIYFSLGAFVQSSKMPAEKVQIFLDTFKTMKQKVLWKWEDENIPNLPANVRVAKWMPQSDILAHPNVKLFITHGGLFGTLEGSWRGVPMLYMPFYGDQYRNAMRSSKAGYARTLKFSQVTRQTLATELDEMLHNKKYYNRAKEVSRLFQDNLNHPMEEALYWIEYVIRNNGAKHLKSKAVDMPFYEYFMLDILGLFLACIITVWIILCKVIKMITGKSVVKKVQKKTKKN